jgi:predicted DNA-binding WGR domain protein
MRSRGFTRQPRRADTPLPDKRSPVRHHPVMHRRDPEQGRLRYYSLLIECDLFGAMHLVRNRRLVGSRGQEWVEVFSETEAGQSADEMLPKLAFT